MKISELAKDLNITSKEVIKVLQDNGYDYKSPQKILADAEVDLVRKNLTASSAPVKETAKKEAPAKKAAAKKEAIYVQFAGKSYSNEELLKIAKDVWVYDMGQKAADMKSVEIYVKPEESMAYFVVNGTENGSFMI